MPEEVKDQIVDLVGCKREDIIEASAKTGMGVDKILLRDRKTNTTTGRRSGCAFAGPHF